MAPVPPWSQSKACFLFRKLALRLYPWEELAEPPASGPLPILLYTSPAAQGP